MQGIPRTRQGRRFNTQPRGGGCIRKQQAIKPDLQFQHTAARRRLLHALRALIL